MVRLGDLFEFKNGRSFSKTEWKETGLPIIRIQNLNAVGAGFNYFDGDYDESIEVNKNDLLFSWSGTIGSSFGPHIWSRDKGVLNQHIYKVSFKTDMILKYAYYALLFLTEEIESSVVGAVGLVHVTKKSLNEFKISAPTVSEQKRIVTILDQAFSDIEHARAKTEQNLKNARELFESYLQQVFGQRGDGWVISCLGDLADINYGYTEKASFESVGPHFLRITDIQDGIVNWDTVPHCPISEDDYIKHKLMSGDIVFARTGATTGKSYLLSNPPDSVAASYLIRLRLKVLGIVPEFVRYFFQTKDYWDVVLAGMSGSAQGGFNASKLSEMNISYPSCLREQKILIDEFKNIAKRTDELKFIYTNKLSALDELKKSILQKAFTGQLTNKKGVGVAA